MISLSRLNIKPCAGEDACFKDGKCRIKDDMALLIQKIDSCDGVIIACPVYFGSVTAQLKAAIDRCQQLWVKKYRLGKKTSPVKRGGFICVSKYKNRDFFRNSKEIIEIFFRVLDTGLVKALWLSGLEDKGAAKTNKACLEKAYRLGGEIANLK
jgi:hypothetical protein